MTHIKILKSLGACDEAVKWAESQPDLETAWDNCNNPQWMLWLDRNMNLFTDSERRLMACAFVRRTPFGDGRVVWDLLTDKRSRNAVEVSERYAHGKATDDELEAAEFAAWSATRSASRSASRFAAWSASRSAAWSATRSATWSASESAAEFASRSAAEFASRSASESAQCDIIRKWGNPLKGNERKQP